MSCWEWHQRKLLSSMKGTGNSSYFFRVCLGARCLSVYCTISLLFWIPSFPLIPEVGRWSLCGLSSTMAVVEPGCGGSLVHASVEKVACCTAGSALQITFLGANSLFPVKNVFSVWDTCRQRPHGSKPIFFSHTGLTTEWVLHRPTVFLTST